MHFHAVNVIEFCLSWYPPENVGVLSSLDSNSSTSVPVERLNFGMSQLFSKFITALELAVQKHLDTLDLIGCGRPILVTIVHRITPRQCSTSQY